MEWRQESVWVSTQIVASSAEGIRRGPSPSPAPVRTLLKDTSDGILYNGKNRIISPLSKLVRGEKPWGYLLL